MLALGANGRGRAGLLSALRPQDVFATSLYTGTGAAQTITTGFAPDLVWQKNRSATQSHTLIDRLRGGTLFLSSDTTAAESSTAGISFGASGFSTNGVFQGNSGNNYVAWPFKRASKFFDIVTYTGDGTSGRVIPHALGIKPGMIIVKRREISGNNWVVYHRSLTASGFIVLNTTSAAGTNSVFWNNIEPTDTGFTLGSNGAVNDPGGTYVAYLFAHDPDTTNGIVQCGSYTTNASGQATVALGWRPQWLLIKRSSGVADWYLVDAGRGLGTGSVQSLSPNTSGAEVDIAGSVTVSSTGFAEAGLNAPSSTMVFAAIRAPT